MAGEFRSLPEAVQWRILVGAAQKGAGVAGYELQRVPGRGLSNIFKATKNGSSQIACIRTTRDRWIAFPPLQRGAKWKTLSDVELVIVATVDSKDDPQKVLIYILPAKEVREHFDAAYAARIKAGRVVRERFGMWVSLYRDPRGGISSVGSGMAERHKPVAVYALVDLITDKATPSDYAVGESQSDDEIGGAHPRLTTISEVMAWARERVAEIAGVRLDAVKLDLKLEY